MANTALFLVESNCLLLWLHPAFPAGPWKPHAPLWVIQTCLVQETLQLWLNAYHVPNSGEAALSLHLEGAQTRASIKAGTNCAVNHTKDRENERGGRGKQPDFRLFPLNGVGNSEAPLMQHYILPLRSLWESRCYKFRVKMMTERKGRKVKGQNRWISTPVIYFWDLLRFKFSMGRAPGRPRACGKSLMSHVYLHSLSFWWFSPLPFLHTDVGRPGWRNPVSESLPRRLWFPMHLYGKNLVLMALTRKWQFYAGWFWSEMWMLEGRVSSLKWSGVVRNLKIRSRRGSKCFIGLHF